MPDLRWTIAGVAVVAAAGVAGVAFSRGMAGGEASFRDERGDVTGTATPEVERSIDITSAALARDRDGLDLVIRVAEIDRAAVGDDAAVFVTTLQSASARYRVRVRIATAHEDAVVLGGRDPSRPFVLDGPGITQTAIRVRIPDDAIEELGDRFSWGIEATASGSGDRAPQDLAALFPQREETRS